MKLRTVYLVSTFVAILGLAACAAPSASPSAGGTSIVVSCDDFSSQPHPSKSITVSAGDLFTVTLCSNPTTGFSWSESAQISDATVVQQVSHNTIAPENKNLVGAPGSEVWVFKALKKGSSTVTMEYSRPWAGGEKGVWTLNLTVDVK
jgi:inhibitor of cysteine peptidase